MYPNHLFPSYAGTQFIRSKFVLVLDLFQIILQLMLEIIDLNIKSLHSERSSIKKGSDQYSFLLAKVP